MDPFVLFIKPEDLKRNTIFDGSLDSDKFKQYIEIAQDLHIQNYLGTKLYRRLQEGIEADDLNADERLLIDDFIKRPLIHFTAAEFLPFSPYSIKNGGAYKHLPEDAETMNPFEIDKLVTKELGYAEFYAKRLVDFLRENSTKYPEYLTNTQDDIHPDRFVNTTSGFRFTTSSRFVNNDDCLRKKTLLE